MKIIAKNKKAWLEYALADTFEAGLVLTGPEIKAIRANRLNMTGSHIRMFLTPKAAPEFWWLGANLNLLEGDNTRNRKLLLNKREANQLANELHKEQLIVPLELYLKHGRAKLKIAVAKRLQKQDKREILKKRDADRQIERSLAARRKPSR